MSKERRRHHRFQVPLSVKVTGPDNLELVLRARDFSDGGLFLETDDTSRLPPGTPITVQAREALGGETPPAVTAEVVRVTGEGVGVRFLD